MPSLIDQASNSNRTENSSSSSCIATTTTIIPDANGLQDICHRLHDHQECVVIPTECTYEIIQPIQYDPTSNTTSTVMMHKSIPPSQPHHCHVYIPSVSILETCPFWKRVLPKKSYAIRKEPHSTTAIVATFNESVHVLRRLSTKCWPGPILIYVQVPFPMDGLTITVTVPPTAAATGTTLSATNDNDVTNANESSVQHYIALRKPCHPLSRKVCTEYYKRQFRCRNHAGTGGGIGSSNHSSCASTPSASPMFMSLRTPDTPRLSSVSSRLEWQLPHSQQQQLLPPPPFMLTPPYRRVESCVSLATSTTSSSLPDGPDDADADTTMLSCVLNDTSTDPPGSKNLLTQEPTEPLPQPTFLLVGSPMMKGDWERQPKKRKASQIHNDDTYTCTNTPYDIGSEYVQTADEAIAALSRQQYDAERKDHSVDHKNNDITVNAVLHGEEQCEILSVPTCMNQEPYPTSIWIDSTNRMVRIKTCMKENHLPKADHAADLTQQQQRTMSPHSTIMTSHNSFLSLQQEGLSKNIDETSILQSLRAIIGSGRRPSPPPPPVTHLTTSLIMTDHQHHHPSPIATTTTMTIPTTKVMLSPKERVLHAVLLKWNVVTEP